MGSQFDQRTLGKSRKTVLDGAKNPARNSGGLEDAFQKIAGGRLAVGPGDSNQRQPLIGTDIETARQA